MSLPSNSQCAAPAEPAPVEAFETEQHGDTVTDLNDVMRLWMSSIRRNYRRPIRGRSTLLLPGTLPVRGRHRAP